MFIFFFSSILFYSKNYSFNSFFLISSLLIGKNYFNFFISNYGKKQNLFKYFYLNKKNNFRSNYLIYDFLRIPYYYNYDYNHILQRPFYFFQNLFRVFNFFKNSLYFVVIFLYFFLLAFFLNFNFIFNINFIFLFKFIKKKKKLKYIDISKKNYFFEEKVNLKNYFFRFNFFNKLNLFKLFIFEILKFSRFNYLKKKKKKNFILKN